MEFNKTAFQNIGIKQSLFVLFAVLSGLHYVVGTFSFAPLIEIGRDFSDLRLSNLRAVTYLTQVERAFLKLRLSRTRYSSLDLKAKKDLIYQEKIWIHQIEMGLKDYSPLADTETERVKLKIWNDSYAQYSKNRMNFFKLVDSKMWASAKKYEVQQIFPFSEAAESSLEDLITYQNDEALTKQNKVASSIGHSKMIITVLTLISALVGGLLTWLSVNWISKSQHQKLETLGKMSALGEITGNIAQEIIEPLTVLLIVSEHIHEISEEPQIDHVLMRTLVGKLQVNISRVRKIISGLKVLSKDVRTDPFNSFNVKNMAEETLAICLNRIRSRSVIFTMEPILENLTVEGRPSEISQVIINLISNALDAISDLNEKWIAFSVADLGEFIEISVVDSGGGIQKKIREKMFRASFTTKPFGIGTGIGLVICKKIIDSHHGIIFVDEKCKNTRIVIQMPKRQTSFLTQAS